MSNVMHHDLSYSFLTDATWSSKFGTSSHSYCCSYLINVRMRSALESVPVFSPVMVEVKADCSVFLALFPLNKNGEPFSEAFEDFGNADFIFLCQGFSEGEFEDILNPAQLSPVVYKAV